jgi:hypothetical protein
MKRSLAIVGALTAAVLVAVAPAGGAGLTREKLDELTKKLEAAGQAWLKGEPAQAIDLKAVSFSTDSVGPLSSYLSSPRRGPGWTYAVNKLLEQLRHAEADVLKAALPAVETAQSRATSAYRPLPRYPKGYLASLKMPDRAPNTAEIMARMSMLEKRRDEKVTRELPIVRANELARDIERNAYEIMLSAADAKKDDAVVKALVNAELRNSAMFLTLLDLIDRAAGKMAKERALGLYGRLKPHGMRLAMAKKKDYFDRGRVLVQRNDASGYEKKSEYPGIKIIQAMNKLAKPAGMPKLTVPDGKKIDELHKNKGRK